MSDLTLEIPLRITLSLGTATPTPPTAKPGKLEVGEQLGLERVERDYSSAKGYDPDFLGIKVPLPKLTDEQRRNAARNTKARPGQDPTVLTYPHFSIVMNRRRQLAFYTAVNINGAKTREIKRSRDVWFFDSRIAQSEQIGGDLYVNNGLDRGHLARRLDPSWGTEKESLEANDATFCYTNCSPQHEKFNQNNDTWQGIEDYLLKLATAERMKMTIFTGPITTEEDPLYRGVRLPLAFWKIAVCCEDDGTLLVTAYILEQEDLLKNLDTDAEGLERCEPTSFQVTVEEICERTGLDFSYLAKDQADLSTVNAGPERAGEYARQPLSRTSQILLKKGAAK